DRDPLAGAGAHRPLPADRLEYEARRHRDRRRARGSGRRGGTPSPRGVRPDLGPRDPAPARRGPGPDRRHARRRRHRQRAGDPLLPAPAPGPGTGVAPHRAHLAGLVRGVGHPPRHHAQHGRRRRRRGARGGAGPRARRARSRDRPRRADGLLPAPAAAGLPV
ncbi:MAG: hypothetical protein AVDCRST_MAG54-1115, partial [uncultured Actinomycetospora sp.]